jgi:hypothetical protein
MPGREKNQSNSVDLYGLEWMLWNAMGCGMNFAITFVKSEDLKSQSSSLF